MSRESVENAKVAIITGATHGIGLALSENLLSHGWIVFGVGRDNESLQRTASKFQNFRPIQADLTNNDDLKRIAETIRASNLPIHLSVQNAGMKTPPRNLDQHSCEAIDEVIAVNLTAPMKLTSLLSHFMVDGSRILYVTSRAATLQLKESSTYCASKAGLDQVAGIVRQELQERNIGVACVIPGEVDTHIQEVLRETKTFHLSQLFKRAHEQKQLISPKICADYLKWVLCDMPFEAYKNSNLPMTIYDDSHHEHWLKSKAQLPAFPFSKL